MSCLISTQKIVEKWIFIEHILYMYIFTNLVEHFIKNISLALLQIFSTEIMLDFLHCDTYT